MYYRWHPLYGLVLPIWRRIKYQDGERIYCKAPDDRICILPGWMLHPECAQLCMGSPFVSVEALTQLYDLLRDLKGLHDFEPSRQQWASQMAALLIEARDAASAARQAGQSALGAAVLEDLVTRYRELATAGLAANLYRRTATAKDARRIARRFLGFEDLILRFATRPDLDIFSNNEAERTIRPVKVQQRSSGGSWRTLEGLADFALVQSYLSTAHKWGTSKLDALRDLFTGHAWLPPGLEPSG